MTVIISALAAEAVVNRLLEPRIAPEKWGGRKGIERKAALDRNWILLFRTLGLPELQNGHEPLVGLRELIALRHELVHFKHGPTLTIARTLLPAKYADRHLTVDARAVGNVEPPIVHAGRRLRERLHPQLAVRYFGTLKVLVSRVLEVYPEDEVGIVAKLRDALG